MRYFYSIIVFLFGIFNVHSSKLSSAFKFDSFELEYKTKLGRAWDVRSGLYKPEIIIPSDFQVYYKNCKQNRLFLALPRAERTIPATLVEVIQENGRQILEPYPTWPWNRISRINPCEITRILSVHKIAVDRCDRLWVLDEGIYQGIDETVKCPKQLLAFDLIKDKLIHRYTLPEEGFHNTSHILSLVVDINDNDSCEKARVYISDGASYSITVYSMQYETSWVFKHSTLVPNVTESTPTSNFNEIGMGVSRDIGQFFYTPFAGTNMFAIRVSTLSNGIQLLQKEITNTLQINEFTSPRTDQIGTFVIDTDGISFSNVLNSSSLVCWNTKNVIYRDNMHLIEQFPGIMNMKIVDNECSPFLYILSSHQQNNSSTSYQISYAKTEDLVVGTNCTNFQPFASKLSPSLEAGSS